VKVLSQSNYRIQVREVYKGKMFIDVFLFRSPSVTYFLKYKEGRF
jgi:hypothetical protein